MVGRDCNQHTEKGMEKSALTRTHATCHAGCCLPTRGLPRQPDPLGPCEYSRERAAVRYPVLSRGREGPRPGWRDEWGDPWERPWRERLGRGFCSLDRWAPVTGF